MVEEEQIGPRQDDEMQLWKEKGKSGVDLNKTDLIGGVEERASTSSGTLQADDDK